MMTIKMSLLSNEKVKILYMVQFCLGHEESIPLESKKKYLFSGFAFRVPNVCWLYGMLSTLFSTAALYLPLSIKFYIIALFLKLTFNISFTSL